MVCRQKLKISSSVSRKESSATELGDARPTSQSPEATVTEADDKIRVKVDNLISKSIQFIDKLARCLYRYYLLSYLQGWSAIVNTATLS